MLATQDGTFLQEIRQNLPNETISFSNLKFFPNEEINAIAYHPSQNVIYGVLQTPPFRLCRIDAAFNLEVLQELDLPEDLIYVSGDISPDERHLVLFGFGDKTIENIVALVDVENDSYDTQILTLQTTNSNQPNIFCADIAFHPTTGKLFGFDFKNGRLVKLDINERLIDNTAYPISNIVVGNVPSIFFNADGNLFGIGTNLQEMTENRGYYQFDLNNGQPSILQELEIEKNQDACSCPYTIKLLNEVRQRQNLPCTELAFEITLINKTDEELFDLNFSDTFPQGLLIKDISPLPFNGIIESSLGSNILSIKNLHLPIGNFSFEIILQIEENSTLGEFNNQAILSGIQNFESGIIYSDDPVTPIPNDPTAFSIDTLANALNDKSFQICKRGTTLLDASAFGANSYTWSTGDTTESIVVQDEGIYQVTITTECAQTIGTATVKLDEISLDLGKDLTIEKGETIKLKPNYSSLTNITTFNWESSSTSAPDCPSCESPSIQPLTDTELNLMMENASGCRANDLLRINVTDIKVYHPNIFTPNNDNKNDAFYLSGNLPYNIKEIQIFDRWGNLIFKKKNIIANEIKNGWNGTKNGEPCLAGVYYWTAIIRYKSGQLKTLNGNVTLFR